MIQFACPGCGVVYSVGDEKAGKSGKCPKCLSQFVIPEGGAVGATAVNGPEPPPLPLDKAPPPLPSSVGTVEVAPCPGCKVRLSVEATNLGTDVECPYCQTVFRAERVEPSVSKRSGSENAEARDRNERPSRRSRRDEEDDRPSRRRSRRDDDDDYDDRPRRSGIPSEITAVGGMMLGGGIYALVQAGGMILGSTGICCLWPGTYFALVVGIMAIIRGSAILNKKLEQGPPRTLLIMQIILIINFDVVNCILGIIGLVLLNNPAARRHYERYEMYE